MHTENNPLTKEDKLIKEFKIKFFNELGYEPTVLATSNLKLDEDKYIKVMSLEKLKECFNPFLPSNKGIFIELNGKTRKNNIVELRVIFSFISRSMGYVLSDIGKFLKKDHSTIIHSINNFKNWIEVDPCFRDKYNTILKHIYTIQNFTNESSTLEHTNQMECQS